MIDRYKMMHYVEKVNRENFPTEGHLMKLCSSRFRGGEKGWYFVQHIINLRNLMPWDMLRATTIDGFTRVLHNFKERSVSLLLAVMAE